MTVLVTVEGGVVTVTDRGQAADELAASGLDVSKRSGVGRAFAAQAGGIRAALTATRVPLPPVRIRRLAPPAPRFWHS